MSKRFDFIIAKKRNAEEAKKEVLHAETEARLKILKPVITEIIDFLEYISTREDFRFSSLPYPSKNELQALFKESELNFIRHKTIESFQKNRKCEIPIYNLCFSNASIHICFKTVDFEPIILIGKDHSQEDAQAFKDSVDAMNHLTGLFVEYRRKS